MQRSSEEFQKAADDFHISIQTEQATLYHESMPPMPVPRVGEEVFVPGEGMGYWLVKSVGWSLPSPGAMKPSIWVTLTVEWSPRNDRPAPVYDEDRGWIRSEKP